jgi:capsular polysaccharide transport system permease protein
MTMVTIAARRLRKGYFVALQNWSQVVTYLMVQDLASRFRGSRVAAVFAFCEPLLLVLVLVLMRGVFRGRIPEYGTSIWVFFSSGVFPFYIFQRVSARTRVRYEASKRLPRVSSTEMVVASSVAEAALILASTVTWFTILWICGEREAIPTSLGICLMACFFLVMLGMGVGLINSVAFQRFPIWAYVYPRLSRFLMLLSGIYWVVDLMPYFIRNIVVWFPTAHAIEWFRLGLYGRYPIHTLDVAYFIGCAAGALFLGILVHFSNLRFVK